MKKLIAIEKGIVEEIKVPNILNYDYYLPDELVDKLVFKVRVNDKSIILTGNREKFSDLYVGDEVSVNKYSLSGNYSEYLDNIKKIIDITYLDKNKDFKEKELKKYFLDKEEYNKKPREIIEYELV